MVLASRHAGLGSQGGALALLVTSSWLITDAMAQEPGEELHWQVERGDVKGVQALLEQGSDPSLANRLGVTPLYLAAANGDAAIIELLLAAGADANARDTIGETMLMAAVGSGELPAVTALLEHGAAVDALDTAYEQTALMFAARLGHEPIVEALLDAGAAVDARTRIGSEPRWVLPNSRAGFGFGKGIIRGGLPEDRGMRPFRSGGLTPLLYAAREGHAGTVARLLDAGAAIDGVEANGIAPLLMAIANDRMATATLLIERGAALDQQDWYGRSPLWEAVNVRNLYVHNQTFEHDVDREGALGVIRLLLERGVDPNPRTKESPPVRNHLLATTGTLEWVDFTGQTPFLSAALAGDVTVMRLLLDHGADPAIATFHGTTPLMAAAGVNWVVSQTYTEGPEALLAAVQLCHERGLDVNAVNSMGITAVMGAANRGSDAIIEYLVANGARLDVVDDEGRSPLDWARGVFLATHPPEPKPSSIALIERLAAD
jgi:ankyrin repeat protein